jgi:hypothetical protein
MSLLLQITVRREIPRECYNFIARSFLYMVLSPSGYSVQVCASRSSGHRFGSRHRRICCSYFLVGDSKPITYLTSLLMSMLGQCNAQQNNSDCDVLPEIILDIYIAIEYLWRYTRPIELLCRHINPTTECIVLTFLLMDWYYFGQNYMKSYCFRTEFGNTKCSLWD